MSREGLSGLVGVGPKSIQRIEGGQQTPSLATLRKLQTVLNFNIDGLAAPPGIEPVVTLADLARGQKDMLERLELLTVTVKALADRLENAGPHAPAG